jgi:hypothetical protein
VAGELSPAPLLAAVNAVRATPGNGAGRCETTAPAPWADVVLAGLEELASAGPVLVTVDDVQWADPATMQAFRSMPRLLASYPLSWILAMGTSADAGQAERLFDLLETDRAARITLGPLDLAAQVALAGDVLGAIPDQGLIELAADAAGNPLVLAEASLITVDPRVLAGCIGYLEGEACPVLESQSGSLGLLLLASDEPGVAIFESFWATHEALWLSEETEALFRGELARRGQPAGGGRGLPGGRLRAGGAAAQRGSSRRQLQTWSTCMGTPRSCGWLTPPVSAARCCSLIRPAGSYSAGS